MLIDEAATVARERRADSSGADITGADVTGADVTGADSRGGPAVPDMQDLLMLADEPATAVRASPATEARGRELEPGKQWEYLPPTLKQQPGSLLHLAPSLL